MPQPSPEVEAERTNVDKLLRDWPYDPENAIRVLNEGEDCEVLQIRIDQGGFQGILQMDLDGRPDGGRPDDAEFCLDFQRARLASYKEENGSDEGFLLDGDTCAELFDEGFRVYQRYVFLLQLQDYPRVIRDTIRNMELFRFVNRYAEAEEDRLNLEKWWPYIIRIHAEAQALQAVEQKHYDAALGVVEEARAGIEKLSDVNAEEFYYEKGRSIQELAKLEEAIAERKPLSSEERLRRELKKAVRGEEFERAAVLRDRLRALSQTEG